MCTPQPTIYEIILDTSKILLIRTILIEGAVGRKQAFAFDHKGLPQGGDGRSVDRGRGTSCDSYLHDFLRVPDELSGSAVYCHAVHTSTVVVICKRHVVGVGLAPEGRACKHNTRPRSRDRRWDTGPPNERGGCLGSRRLRLGGRFMGRDPPPQATRDAMW